MLEFTLKTSDVGQRYLLKVARKLDKTKAALTQAGLYMLGSIDKNFQQEGRPNKWAPLSKMTKALRRGSAPFRILQNTGRLKSSIAYQVSQGQVKIGTNVEYASLMQHGGRTKEGHKVPARPFLVFQSDDIKSIRKLFLTHVKQAAK